MKEVKNIELIKVLKYKDKYFIYAFKESERTPVASICYADPYDDFEY